MLTFFPGPSQIYPQIKHYLQDAYEEGILSISHRSDRFNQLSEKTLQLIRNKLAVPDGYEILYTTSATECWEILAQSLTRKQSVHFHSGSFGEKWFQYAKALRPDSRGIEMPINEALYADYLDIKEEDELICLTQNETSNATQIDFETIAAIRGAFPDKLIAYDCTSSMAGINLPFSLGDVWFASVQKCFGLPAGLGILILSPNAVKRAFEINDKKHYNSLIIMLDNIAKYQTSCTPNVLGIYLLNRVLQQVNPIEEVDQSIRSRMKRYESLVQGKNFHFLIDNPAVRSSTVIALKSSPEVVDALKQEAKNLGILLGSGYGKWKSETFRIANFPAYSDAQVQQLIDFLRDRI
jgi:phosphoserine aminotransferase